jgi:DNA-binding XRE family transcriptional regulator
VELSCAVASAIAEPQSQNTLLVGLTSSLPAGVLDGVPTRPSQNDPKRVVAWERRRRMVGTRIQALRIERGLTQEHLAQVSGVSRNVLMDVEHGRRGILHERLFDIAKALGVSAADLLEGIR